MSLKSLSWAFTATYRSTWQPIVWLSYMLDYQMVGLKPGWFHLTNLIFHIANSLLLFFLFRKMTDNLWQSVLIAAIFAIHPIHIESVAWVASRKDVLSMFFGLLSMHFYLQYVRRPRIITYLLIVILLALGLLAKPILVTYPFVLLLLDYWPLNRLKLRASGSINNNLHQQHSLRHLVLEKFPLFIIIVISSAITYITQEGGGAVCSFDTLPLNFRISNALVSYTLYLWKMIWPFRLAIFYPLPKILPGWQVAASCVFISFISVLSVINYRSKPWFIVGWLWYMGTLIPVIGIIQIGAHRMADRFAYIPSIGIYIIIANIISMLLSNPKFKKDFIPIGILLFLTLMVSSWTQVRYWTNSITIFTHALNITTANDRAHINLSSALLNKGKIVEAIKHCHNALKINPESAQAHNNLGTALEKQGKSNMAIYHLQQALHIEPYNENLHYNLGIIFAKQKKFTDAMDHFAKALQIKPDFINARQKMNIVARLKKKN